MDDAYDAVTTVRVGAPGILGNDGDHAGVTIELLAMPQHGRLEVAQDGSFTYVPDPEFSGADAFRYRLVRDGRISNAATVTFQVGDPSPAPAPPPPYNPETDDAFGVTDGASAERPLDMHFGSADLLSASFEWTVPSLALSVPGLLLMTAVMAQSLGALAWLPAVRRWLGTFGFGWRRRRPEAA